ncbi:hypothetical protein [Nordella sp. HKS 07]|uniref:hypothetical protein n=1 Tax=Nordella sp. HKS 07 TaxID=2712222 RepID=UPI0019D2D2F0|nr:hypothetical protein [Nordella sp. HKS 07]
MGKRSNFERREADFYPTPQAAVVPLIPHLRGINSFAEPCSGDGTLVRHLEEIGLRCVYAGDIRTGQDALAVDNYGEIDAIITNPPYSRPVMHALISHFEKIAPTWLLLEYDWTATKQARPFMRRCSNIVVIGRLRWIPGTKYSGKDNFAWCRFDASHDSGPILHNGELPSPRRTRMCDGCRKPFQPNRADARFCSNACRQRAYRDRASDRYSFVTDN